MNKIFEQFMKSRGYTSDFIEKINTGYDEKLMDIDRLCQRLHNCYLNNKKIVVLGDFDMDGVSASLILTTGLLELGFNCNLYVPTPEMGYGFREYDIDKILCKYGDVHTIITCDVGITNFDGIKYAKSKSIEFLVTDHHLEDSGRSMADVIVDPYRYDEVYSFKDICGAHVAYLCLENYCKLYKNEKLDIIDKLKIFAYFGTISDGMPLYFQNRVIAKDGINYLYELMKGVNFKGEHKLYNRVFFNLRAFIEQCDLKLNDDMVGFYLAPMINSIKRMDGNLEKVYRIFYGNENDISVGSKYLVDLNNQRKKEVKDYFADIIDEDDICQPYVFKSEARSGILGLLSQKLSDMYGLPNLVVRLNDDGTYSGSGRSYLGYPFKNRLLSIGVDARGHMEAFGVFIENEQELFKVFAFLANDFGRYYNDLPVKEGSIYDYDLSDDYMVDKIFAEYDDLIEFLDELEQFKPFGKGFEEPFGSFTISHYKDFMLMGSEQSHLKINVDNGISIVYFNFPQDLLVYLEKAGYVIEFSGKLKINEFRGDKIVNFIADGYRVVEL